MRTLFAFLHHLGAFTLVAALAIEFTLIRQTLTAASARRLVITDAVLGFAAALVLIAGLMRVLYFEKGAAYYFSNHAFLTKFVLFIALALASLVPTFEFVSWRKALRAGEVPAPSEAKLKSVRTIIHAELAGIVLILLCAAIMAHGGWV
jgi:putative membrane protein